MKNKIIALSFCAIFLSLPFNSNGAGGDMGPYGWALIGLDAALSGAAVWFIVSQNAMAADYDSLRASIDNTTEANYYRLLYEREKVTAMENQAMVISAAAGVAIIYTVVDKLFLHAAFPDARFTINPVNGSAAFILKKEF